MESAAKSSINVSEEEVLSKLANLFDEQALEHLARPEPLHRAEYLAAEWLDVFTVAPVNGIQRPGV